MLLIFILSLLNLQNSFAEEVQVAEDAPSEEVAAPFQPLYSGSTGYHLTAITHSSAEHSGWVQMDSLQNEFAQPGVRLDYLNLFTRNEFQVSAHDYFKNSKKQKLKVEATAAPEAKILPRWSAELVGSSAVYGKPFELGLGVKYKGFANANEFQITPTMTAYLDYGWIMLLEVRGSKVKANTVNRDKWLLGYGLNFSRNYTELSSLEMYGSRTEETTYNPFISDYMVASVTTLGVRFNHWFTERSGVQPELQWQTKNLENLKNWYTIQAAYVFKI